MKIREITEGKKKFRDLLYLADEQEEMIDLYLDRGRMFVLEDDGEICGECVVTDEGDGILEIKNIAVAPAFQKRGFGKLLIGYVARQFQDRYSILQVGTGESPLTVPFYEKCGFVYHHRIRDFFTDHYDHPIYEEGVLLKDMVVLRKSL